MSTGKPRGQHRGAFRFPAGSGPTTRLERAAWKSGFSVVAGVDEVGRGAWAGPLVAAAVTLPKDRYARARLTRTLNQRGLKAQDSKLLSAESRERIVEVLQLLDIRSAVSVISPSVLDRMGVGVANRQALCSAVDNLGDVDFALIDAFEVESIRCQRRSVIRGDQVCLSIALASIVAKVHRDEMMRSLDIAYPGYGFAMHKGYGTRAHARALDHIGVSDQHRRSFRPVADRLVQS
jgi:ribonuclease HII